jgi:cell division protein FtsW
MKPFSLFTKKPAKKSQVKHPKRERFDPRKYKKEASTNPFKLKKPARPKVSRVVDNNKPSREGNLFKRFIDAVFDFRFNHDKRLGYVFLFLLCFGIIAVYSSSIVFADRFTGNKFYFLINHLKFIFVGFIGLAVFYFIRPEIFVKFWFVFLFLSILLLILTLVLIKLGVNEGVDGGNRWLSLGEFRFQPSDFAKLSFVIFIAAFLSRKKSHYKDFKEYLFTNFIPFLFWFGIIMVLILAGKNLGTALVIGFIGLICYGVSIVSKYHKWGFIILLSILVTGGALFGFYERYRMDRIAVLINYWKTGDTLIMESNGLMSREKRSYQFDQGLVTLGSGGATGRGLGESKGKFHLVKTSAGDDSIIVIIGEELGFYITALLLLVYLYLLYLGISIANNFVNKPIYFYLMIGSISWIGFQMFLHVGANFGITPLTGQTLPFISLGGSSLISLMCAMGLILNVSKQDVSHDEEVVQKRRSTRTITF